MHTPGAVALPQIAGFGAFTGVLLLALAGSI
jgi:hypothetical protein